MAVKQLMVRRLNANRGPVLFLTLFVVLSVLAWAKFADLFKDICNNENALWVCSLSKEKQG